MTNPSAVVVISRFLSGMYTHEDLNIFIEETGSVLARIFVEILEFYRNPELLGVSDVEISAEFAIAFPGIEQSHFEAMQGLVLGWLGGTVPEEFYNIAMTGVVSNSTESASFALRIVDVYGY
ncbi:MAG: hypothetical protein KBC27_02820 [Rickettsiales bacterium]|nr:hypothetical protein [Rickettsiales bacterium]